MINTKRKKEKKKKKHKTKSSGLFCKKVNTLHKLDPSQPNKKKPRGWNKEGHTYRATTQTSDGIVTISSWRWCCCIGGEIGFTTVEVVVVFVLANVLSFVVVVVDDATRFLAAGSGR